MENPIKKTINGIDVYYIISDKFKTITWSFNLMHQAGKEMINEYYFLGNLLLDNMKNYRTNEKKYRYLSSLYGLEAFGSAKNIGQNICNQFVVTYPNENYIQGEDKLSENAFKFLIEIITKPQLRKGNFTKKVLKDNVEEAKELFSLLRSIKDMHAYYQYSKLFYNDKENLLYNFPEMETVDTVTLETLHKAYMNFFTTAKPSIFVTGNIQEAKIDQIIEDNLPDVFKNKTMTIETKTFHYQKDYTPKIVKEYFDVSQSRVFVGYLTNIEYFTDNHAKLSVFNEIFGGFDQSLLFSTIRERDNLAYYVDSTYLPEEQMVVVSVSCEVKYEAMVVEKIQAILNDIKQGEFSDELFRQAKESCVSSLYSINDSQTAYLMQHMKSYQLFNQRYDLDSRIQTYQSTTRQDVMDVANTLVLDTVYFYTKQGDFND